MPNSIYLIIDANYLCHRAFYAMGGLQFRGNLTGVIYGVMRDINILRERFDTDDLIFTFDSKTNFRKKIYPQYKAGRQADERLLSKDQIWVRDQFYRQVKKLRTEYLPEIGFRNILQTKGFEADDIIASLCLHTCNHAKSFIVSADEDLFQCLRENVSLWNPRSQRLITERTFLRDYGIYPKSWAMVKAIAGCKTDNIQGIRGIGEKTALKFIKGSLKSNPTAERITAENQMTKTNLRLVNLPFEGTPIYKLVNNEVTERKWRDLMQKLEMPSLKDKWNGQRKLF